MGLCLVAPARVRPDDGKYSNAPVEGDPCGVPRPRERPRQQTAWIPWPWRRLWQWAFLIAAHETERLERLNPLSSR
jgi:hypothetical protein